MKNENNAQFDSISGAIFAISGIIFVISIIYIILSIVSLGAADRIVGSRQEVYSTAFLSFWIAVISLIINKSKTDK